MKNSIVLAAALMILFFASESMAFRPAIIGGIRDGAALGLVVESGSSSNTQLRLGIEANTSSTNGVVFAGGKFFLSNIESRYPMFLSGGIVACLGNNLEAGPYISVIFERFLDVMPLFLEVGIDVIKTGRLQFQAGYYF